MGIGRWRLNGVVLLLVGFVSCKSEPSSFYLVETSSYNSFLWSDEQLPEGELVLDVSYISEAATDLEISVDLPGVLVEPSAITVNGTNRIRFALSKPDIPENDTEDLGAVILKGRGVHSVNGKPIPAGKFGTVALKTDKVMNPLARTLLLVICVLIALALLYSFVVRPLLYSRFRVPLITLEKPEWRSLRIRRYNRIQISQLPLKQTLWRQFVEGKTYTISSPGLPPGMVVVIHPQGRNRLRIESNIGRVSNRYATAGQEVKITSESTGEVLVQFK